MCGIVLLRLKKPLEYYQDKYGLYWAIQQLYLLIEKQQNRGVCKRLKPCFS